MTQPKIQLIHGNMEEELCKFEDDTFDLFITSPPYAEKRKSVYGGVPADEYAEWLLSCSDLIMSKMKNTGSFVLNIKEGASDGIRENYVLEYLQLMSQKYRHVETFIWVKTNPYPTGNKRRLKDSFEYCYQFCKTKEYKFFPENCMVPSNPKWAKSNKARKNKGSYSPNNGSGLSMSKRVSSDTARPSNVITFPCHTTNTKHCAAFPIDLPNFFIKLMTEEGDLVCDPYLGSGTVAESAFHLGRNCVGIEKEQQFYELSCQRISRLTT